MPGAAEQSNHYKFHHTTAADVLRCRALRTHLEKMLSLDALVKLAIMVTSFQHGRLLFSTMDRVILFHAHKTPLVQTSRLDVIVILVSF
eukprot:SAG31_NODE_439_length_15675_cov_6.578390_3_plen_89_part_00